MEGVMDDDHREVENIAGQHSNSLQIKTLASENKTHYNNDFSQASQGSQTKLGLTGITIHMLDFFWLHFDPAHLSFFSLKNV